MAPLEPDLMNAVIVRLHKEFVIEFDPALWRGIEFHHPASDARWIELFIPCGVERTAEIDALTVATDFNHLRAATQRLHHCRISSAIRTAARSRPRKS